MLALPGTHTVRRIYQEEQLTYVVAQASLMFIYQDETLIDIIPLPVYDELHIYQGVIIARVHDVIYRCNINEHEYDFCLWLRLPGLKCCCFNADGELCVVTQLHGVTRVYGAGLRHSHILHEINDDVVTLVVLHDVYVVVVDTGEAIVYNKQYEMLPHIFPFNYQDYVTDRITKVITTIDGIPQEINMSNTV